jgi:hypothetical protein
MFSNSVSIKHAKDQLTALARRVENGETVIVTRNGKRHPQRQADLRNGPASPIAWA